MPAAHARAAPGQLSSRPESSRLKDADPAARPFAVCHARGVLSSMRGPSGGPNLRMRLLAVLVALLLAGPITAALVRAAVAAFRLAV